jgi:hypothetical protein
MRASTKMETNSSSTIICLMRWEVDSRLITPRIWNGKPLETPMSKQSLFFFHYTRAPRQGLSINDEWILKKEVIKLFEAGMYERAHASWSCFDPRFLFVWHCSIKLLQNWILKNPLSNPTMSIALFIPKWRYVSVYLQAHDIWDQTKHPFESTFHEDYAEVMYFWFWVLPSVAVTSLIYPYIFKFYNITTEKRFPVFHPALQWDPISWVDTCPVHLFHHIP